LRGYPATLCRRQPMNPRRISFPLALFTIALIAACGGPPPPETGLPDAGRQPVGYFVRVELAGAMRFDISMTTDRVRRDSVDFVLPSWVPGQYGQLASQIQAESFSVRDGGGDPVSTRRISATRWRLYPEDTQYLSVAYQILPDPTTEPLPFRTRIDLHTGYALGAGLFATLEGF
jgi:predicted metalloprotease with PDZ domain